MSRRTRTSLALLVSCCVAFCMRRPNCSLSSAFNSVARSAADFSRRSFLRSLIFIERLLAHEPVHEGRAQRQLCRAERESLAGHRLVHAVHFVEHLPRHDLADVVLRIALAVAHA